MPQQTINIGTTPNDNTGDPARTAFTKVNENFTELYTAVNPVWVNFSPKVADASSGGNEAGGGEIIGRYLKMGSFVTCVMSFANIDTTGLTASNGSFITGLPFPIKALSPNMYWPVSVRYQAITTNVGLVAHGVNNSSYITLLNNTVSGTTSLLVSAISSGTADLAVSLTYET